MRQKLIFAFALVLMLGSVGCVSSLLDRFGIRIRDNQIQFDDHIYFASDSDVILEESYPLLDALAQTLRDHPEIHRVRVVGHTDAQGSTQHNQDLSERRAASVATYLVNAEVQQTLVPEGLGESEPLCDEDTDECHARNRRVEFLIVE